MSLFFPKDEAPGQLLPDPGPQGPPGPTGPQGPAGASTWDELTGKPTEFAPAAHSHGNISNTGTVGSTSGLPLKTGSSGVVEAGAFGISAGQFCEGNDARLSNSRTPTAHAASHASGGSDALAPANIGALPDAIIVSGAGSSVANGIYTKGSGSLSTIPVPSGNGTLYQKSGAWIFAESTSSNTRIGIINPSNGNYFYYRDYADNLNVPSFVGGLTFNVTGSQGTGSFPNPLQVAHTHAIADITGLQAALDAPVATAITSAAAPITAGSVGSAGSIRYDADYIYICTATNTWRRTAITSW